MTDREKLLEIRKSVSCHKDGCRFCDYSKHEHCMEELLVDHLLAHGVVVREKGEWEDVTNPQWPAYSHDKCNICGWWNTKNAMCYDGKPKRGHSLNFCPNCGADMRKGENE